ncbi:MAG: glycosyltransferase family 39 protein [Thermoanaerobaculales bacterium]|jgi:hypothetical protein|nr:glycosyltransferase family 39 protein [Thermoanaerobaculales bacterium]
MDRATLPPLAWRLIAGLAGFKLLLHLVTTGAWGSEWFVDELYFMACAEHLAWGYVDLPPLLPAVLAAVGATLGDSLLAIRLVPALAGAGLVVLAAALARELGGGRAAQATAGLCVILAPIYLVMHSFATMNALDPLFWTGCALVLARILNGGDTRLWLLFGSLAGLGVNSKHTFLLWGLAVVVGLVATPARRELGSRWIWLGGGLALLMILPNLAWVAGHGFPHLEQLANIRSHGRDVALSGLGLVAQQALLLNPPALVIWVGGLVWLLRSPAARPYRALGIAWLAVMVAIIATGGRAYYPAPAHPVLLAAGAVALERLAAAPRRRWLLPAVTTVMIAVGVVVAPIALWVLPPGLYVRYTRVVGFDQPRIENHRLGPLPQLFADRYGWREMAEEVARVYHALPPEERARASVFGQNYGQAGAVDRYRSELGLPPAISGHLTYFLWGPGEATGEVMIVLDDDRETLEELFESVELAGRVEHPYSMPYQHFDIHVCRGLKVPVDELWPRVKQYS